ncbi:gliding motility lipoprotein GldB [Lutibacter sp. A64]|uniref:gliding motility lipoprotein GldB n=1 Tax=Lutibacter sp. A64 TaxID=2918526 RepID=UPI001F059E3B|nr:gliding motility lipoprotein GldB [Lutibacter sp. A64]UMB52513.1 gliding motility lipoprotein GldB [Lutibacter sp. A64]
MNKILILLLVLLISFSCKNEINTDVDVSNIAVNVEIDRFEQQFYTTTAATLPKIKSEYPYLFPVYNTDSIWLQKIKDEDEIKLFNETQKVFGDFKGETLEIEDLFKHIKYYNKNFKAPKVITLVTDLDYESKVIYADSLLFVALDMYLGKKNPVYIDFPAYISKNFEKKQLVVDIATEISKRNFNTTRKRQFLDVIIDEGKRMFLIESYLPKQSKASLLGYTSEEYEWAVSNESQIWKYFIENKLLYSSDTDLRTRFVDKAPFSKFFIDIDKETPGSIGVWLGWQIVKSYMNNNNVTLQQLLQTNADQIFNKSKYKPKK